MANEIEGGNRNHRVCFFLPCYSLTDLANWFADWLVEFTSQFSRIFSISSCRLYVRTMRVNSNVRAGEDLAGHVASNWTGRIAFHLLKLWINDSDKLYRSILGSTTLQIRNEFMKSREIRYKCYDMKYVLLSRMHSFLWISWLQTRNFSLKEVFRHEIDGIPRNQEMKSPEIH